MTFWNLDSILLSFYFGIVKKKTFSNENPVVFKFAVTLVSLVSQVCASICMYIIRTLLGHPYKNSNLERERERDMFAEGAEGRSRGVGSRV